jgi:hypothetical protein
MKKYDKELRIREYPVYRVGEKSPYTDKYATII